MRYISRYNEQVLLSGTGNITPPVDDPQPVDAYKFYQGELVVGDPTTSGTGNVILYANLMEIYPLESGNAKYGLGIDYWEAPLIGSGTALTVGVTYQVKLGSVTYNSATYGEHEYFVCVSGHTAFTGTGTIAKALDAQYRLSQELNLQSDAYKVLNLSSFEDEASWDEPTMQQNLPTNPYTWVRS